MKEQEMAEARMYERESEQNASLFRALSDAIGSIDGVEARGMRDDKGGKYAYLLAEDVFAAVRGAFACNGLSLFVDAEAVFEPFAVKVTATICHTEGGRLTVRRYRPVDRQGKQVGTAFDGAATRALKHLLRDLLLIPSVDEATVTAAQPTPVKPQVAALAAAVDPGYQIDTDDAKAVAAARAADDGAIAAGDLPPAQNVEAKRLKAFASKLKERFDERNIPKPKRKALVETWAPGCIGERGFDLERGVTTEEFAALVAGAKSYFAAA